MSDRALLIALRCLRRRDHLEAELKAALEREQLGHEWDRVRHKLHEWRFLDDHRTASVLTERRQEKGYGKERILAELDAKGADPEILAEIEAWFDPAAEADRAGHLLRKKYLPSDAPIKGARYLAGRGFDEDIVRSVVEAYFEASLEGAE
ncbi:MAG: regulatory protein RecX [Chthonomonas sp.]|nr:regulatory protein RecX [Chthonomonas sp.]